jgi:hypothetical protein
LNPRLRDKKSAPALKLWHNQTFLNCLLSNFRTWTCLISYTSKQNRMHNIRGRVSKYVTNGSKTAVMAVISFLFVSAGSRTVQLHVSLGIRCPCACSEPDFGRQNGDCALRSILPKSSILLCVFCGHKDSIQRIFIQKCSLFRVGSVCRVKRFITGWQTFRWRRRGWNRGVEVSETTVRRLLCYGFRRTGKAVGQVHQFWWRICREMFLPGSNIVCFTFHIHLWRIYRLSIVSDIWSGLSALVITFTFSSL